MNKKNIIIIMFVLFTAICLCSAVSAENLTTTETGTVNGGFYHHTVQPTKYSEQTAGDVNEVASFDITESEEQTTNKITDVEYARLYADVYVAGAANNHTTLLNVTVDGDNDGNYETVLENNRVLNQVSTTDGTIYPVNENITKVYSDYVVAYDVTDFIKNSTIKANVHAVSDLTTGNSQCKIKCIGLVVAYNDDSSDKTINYWVNTGRTYLKKEISSTTFAKADITSFSDATLTQIHTSSSQPTSTFNNQNLTESGSSVYFKENKWNVTEMYDPQSDATLTNQAGNGTYASYASFIATLAVTSEVKLEVTNASITSNSKNALALEDNTMTVELNNQNTVGEATVTLVIDEEEIGNNTIDVTNLDNINTTFTYVPTTNGTKNFKILLNNNEVFNGTFTVYYNGYMGKPFTNNENMTTTRQYKGQNTLKILSPSKYHGSSWAEFTENYDATENEITSQDKIVDVLYYQGYNWNKNLNFQVSINNQTTQPIAQYSDTKGFASYNYPSGLLVYNMTSAFKADAVNNITITPLENNAESLYGGYMVVIYANATSDTNILINEGADMLNPTSSGYGANTSNTYTNAIYTIEDANAKQTTLNVVTAAADVPDGSKIIFNDVEYGSLADNYSTTTQISITEHTITNLNTENTAKLLATNDNVFVMSSILTITYPKVETVVTMDAVEGSILDEITLTANVADTNGNAFTGGRVSFKLNGNYLKDAEGNYVYANVKDGIATATFTPGKKLLGENTISAKFAGNKIYEMADSNETTLTLGKQGTVVTVEPISAVVNQTITVVAHVVDMSGNAVSGGRASFKVNGNYLKDAEGNYIYANVQNGTATFEYTAPKSWIDANFTITAFYRGNAYYDGSVSEEAPITIEKQTTRIVIAPITAKQGGKAQFTAFVTDSSGKSVSGGRVGFKVNGNTLKDAEGSAIYVNIFNGTGSVSVDVSSRWTGENIITGIYGGNSVYETIRGNSTMTITE